MQLLDSINRYLGGDVGTIAKREGLNAAQGAAAVERNKRAKEKGYRRNSLLDDVSDTAGSVWDALSAESLPLGLRPGDFVPGVSNYLSAEDAVKAYRAGDALGVGLGLLGAVPGVGPALAKGGSKVFGMAGKAAKAADPEKEAIKAFRDKPKPREQTVKDPTNYAFDIYRQDRIPELVAEAAGRVAPESPLLKQVLGTSRDELAELAQRPPSYLERPYAAPPGAKGSKNAEKVTTRRNATRVQGIIEESKKYPGLYNGMTGWYEMDPLFEWMKREYGKDRAAKMFTDINAYTSIASPGSDVLTEINRGTSANWLANQGRFDDFLNLGGVAGKDRGIDYPDDMRAVLGHAYHRTAHSGGMKNYFEQGLRNGTLPMDSAKVPSYFRASMPQELGKQSDFPVGDAHWARLVGLPDVRPQKNVMLDDATGDVVKAKDRDAFTAKGGLLRPGSLINGASATVPEMTTLTPWWQKLSGEMGLQSVPAQALVWGAGSGATGVRSQIGAPKLELFMQQVDAAAKRMGVDTEAALDRILRGKAHAG